MPPVDRLRALGHLGPGPLYPLETVISGFSVLFRHFRPKAQIQAALAYPSDRSGGNRQNTRNTLVYGFWSLGAPLVPLDPDGPKGHLGPTPGRLNQSIPASAGIPGGHTAQIPESDGSALF